MKKIVASVGLVALGAAGLRAESGAGYSSDGAKPWRVSVTLRGFYDDNPNTIANSSGTESFGFEVSPSVGVGWNWGSTTADLSYVYSLKYYEHQLLGKTDHWDQTHLFNAFLNHAFSERYRLNIQDSFAIGQEPDVLRAGNAPLSTFQRISGNNIRNDGVITLNARLTTTFALEAGYENAFFDYDNSGARTNFNVFFVQQGFFFIPMHAIDPSFSGVLDRDENIFHLDGRWTLQPQTTGVVGYRFRQVNYSGDEVIGGFAEDPTGAISGDRQIKSDTRDFRQHSAYLGADHTFRPDLSGSVRIGASYIDYYNDISGSGNNWGPYAQGSLRWIYSPESAVELGASHDISATDVVGLSHSKFTQTSEATVAYLSLTHRFTPWLFGNLSGTFQDNNFNGGFYDGQEERAYLIGLRFEYRFNPNFSAEVGYNYDKLESAIPVRNFDRNRVYIGVTAGY